MADETVEEPLSGPAARARIKRHRSGLAATVLLVGIVLVALPFAIRSMAVELLGKQQEALYDLMTNEIVPPGVGAVGDGGNRHYYNIAVISISEADGTATLAISGNRECAVTCPELKVTLYSLDDNAAQRRGLPPSATLTLGADDRVFSESVTLPIRGKPNLYPFDTYDLWLGFSVDDTAGRVASALMDRDLLSKVFVFTLQNQDSGMVMLPPRRIDPAQVVAATDPTMFPLVEALHFKRPDYLKVLSVLLVLLISGSGAIALATRSIGDLVLGVGGLILGVWGIRSVLVTQPLPGVSAVDLALSMVILFLLLGLAIRLAHYFHQHSDLHLPGWLGRRRHGA